MAVHFRVRTSVIPRELGDEGNQGQIERLADWMRGEADVSDYFRSYRTVQLGTSSCQF